MEFGCEDMELWPVPLDVVHSQMHVTPHSEPHSPENTQHPASVLFCLPWVLNCVQQDELLEFHPQVVGITTKRCGPDWITKCLEILQWRKLPSNECSQKTQSQCFGTLLTPMK
uniref:Uncharacterized protein n=1 Tax=Sphaerodactylus townsendi TaxID=933632 RepID=A0ACB8E689_9SAUR